MPSRVVQDDENPARDFHSFVKARLLGVLDDFERKVPLAVGVRANPITRVLRIKLAQRYLALKA